MPCSRRGMRALIEKYQTKDNLELAAHNLAKATRNSSAFFASRLSIHCSANSAFEIESFAFQFEGRSVPMEVCLLRKVATVPGVVRLLDYYERPDSYVLIMERPAGCKDMFDFITDKGYLEEQMAQRFLKQVIQTILACHERGVIHRDIKDENILVNILRQRPEVQLIDFGSGSHITGDTYTDFDGEYL